MRRPEPDRSEQARTRVREADPREKGDGEVEPGPHQQGVRFAVLRHEEQRYGGRQDGSVTGLAARMSHDAETSATLPGVSQPAFLAAAQKVTVWSVPERVVASEDRPELGPVRHVTGGERRRASA
jgi:hypothetical protein